MTASIFDLFDREFQYPIFVCLGDYLAISDVVALTRTCRTLSCLYRDLIPTKWNIDTFLRPFVRHPTRLRSTMANTNALISGSAALSFFQRVTQPQHDLDIYVKEGEESDKLKEYILSEGYTLLETLCDESLDHERVRSTIHMVFGQSGSAARLLAADGDI
ncbi:MAG: hypothetical protein Q9168_002053 [Polycauliona sp. 1 TL-2023]